MIFRREKKFLTAQNIKRRWRFSYCLYIRSYSFVLLLFAYSFSVLCYIQIVNPFLIFVLLRWALIRYRTE